MVLDVPARANVDRISTVMRSRDFAYVPRDAQDENANKVWRKYLSLVFLQFWSLRFNRFVFIVSQNALRDGMGKTAQKSVSVSVNHDAITWLALVYALLDLLANIVKNVSETPLLIYMLNEILAS